MAKPDDVQIEDLDNLREFVIEVMLAMGVWSEEQLTKLTAIDLGVLKRNATQRHGVTRWKRGVRKPSKPEEVEVIDLHPRLLTKEWKPYAAWVMHHEFVHALGYIAHNSTFRSLENLWPSQESSTMGADFTEMLRGEKASWLWVCNTCEKEYPRQKPGKGRYQCRICRTVLIDVPKRASQ
jgi:predicted SprT family Zn-dependent metalloprotease